MLVCLSCNIEYKEDKKFCNYCGGPLVTKEDLTPSQKNIEEKKEERSGQKLICPHCKIIYEFGSSCIQCGSALVAQIPPKEKEELKTNLKPGGEKEGLQPQKPQEQQIKKPHKNLICPTCKIIYERGNSCIKCGSALITQIPAQTKQESETACKPEVEGKSVQLQTLQEQLIEVPHQNLICPDCKIIYERGNSCIRCGSTLVAQIPSQEKEEPKLSKTLEVKPSTSQSEDWGLPSAERSTELTPKSQTEGLGVDPEQPSLPSLKGRGSVAAERVNKKKIEVSPAPEVEVKEESPQTPEQQPTKKSADDLERRVSRPRKRKRDYRRLFREVGSITIMVVAGGYFLWSVYSHFIMKRPEPKATTSQDVSSPALSSPSIPTNVTANVSIPQETERREAEQSSAISKEKAEGVPPPASNFTPSGVILSETPEIGKIKDLLENIRQANLQKNIDLFISCYATDFKDREGKKKATLAYWKKFDYLDLSYDLKNPSISGNTAKARIEWLIKISPTSVRQPQESKTILDVTLKKEEGGWKIKEVKQGG